MARQRGITKTKSNGDHKLADGVRKYQFDDMSDRLAEKMREIRAFHSRLTSQPIAWTQSDAVPAKRRNPSKGSIGTQVELMEGKRGAVSVIGRLRVFGKHLRKAAQQVCVIRNQSAGHNCFESDGRESKKQENS
jgi:hypothetical protein